MSQLQGTTQRLSEVASALFRLGGMPEPHTTVDQRNGMKPKAPILADMPLKLQAVIHPQDDIRFLTTEYKDTGEISIRDFSYTADELQDILHALSKQEGGHALEWNKLQVEMALLTAAQSPAAAKALIGMNDTGWAQKVGGEQADPGEDDVAPAIAPSVLQ